MIAAVCDAQISGQNVPPRLLLHRSDASGTGTVPAPQKTKGTPQTSTCTYNFTAGSRYTYMNYCITANGNFANFQSPAGVEMLDQNGSFEGYGICDFATNVSYFDYNYADSGNWNAPTTVLSTATEVKIERTTSDGLWTLTQTILRVAGPPPYAKMTMALKNNSGTTKNAYLMRFANFNPDHAAATGNSFENYDSSQQSVWGYNSLADAALNGSDQYGMMLQNADPVLSSAVVTWFTFTQASAAGPDPCNPYLSGTITYGNGSGVLSWRVELAKERSVNVSAKYFSF